VGTIAVKLIFDGQAIVEKGFDGVKFVGHYSDPDGRDQFVLCRVTRSAVEKCCPLPTASPDQLLAAYQSISAEIIRLALAQYVGGTERPLITERDIDTRGGMGIVAA
jgi:hypothetical protein